LSPWTARLNHLDVTAAFSAPEGARRWITLLTGLKVGKNALEIYSNGRIRAKLEILNHPLSGPIFSGPQQQPFICRTVENGLGPALDGDCNARTMVRYYYLSSDPEPTVSILDWAKAQAP